MFKITERQKNELKKVLNKDEIETLFNDSTEDFFTDLHLIMIGYMDDDYNHTNESYKLQQLYDEIYNQSLEG